MAIQTYITSTEATESFPQDTDYSSAERTSALERSFGLVNSNINSKLAVPVVGEWDGESTINVPQVLKLAQCLFYRYVLELSNTGWTEELRELFKDALDLTRGITENELTVPSAQTFAHDAGWHITKITQSSDIGSVQVRGSSPDRRKHYKIVISTGGTAEYVAAGTATFTAYRSDTEAAVVTGQALDYDWQMVHDTFEIRFDGQWNNGDEILISGIPETEIDTASKPDNVLRSSPVTY